MKKVWLINDDKDVADYQAEDVQEVLPGSRISIFQDALTAWRSTGKPDLIVIDLSAVGSIVGGPHQCYSPICSIADRHPGVPIIISSAVSKYFALDVADLVKERCLDSIIHLVDWAKCDPSESFKAILRECI